MSGQRRIPLRQVLLFFLAFLVTATAQGKAVASSFGRYHALVIGIQNYQYLTKLKTPLNDAREIARILRYKYGFEVTLLLDETATRKEILRSLEELRRNMKETDSLLIYYAGHGILDKDTGAGYWQPIDAEKYSVVNWIPFTSLINAINGIQAKHILVIADSCFSGALMATRDPGGDLDYGSARWLRRMRENKSRTALTSGGKKERVFDEGGGNHSIFTKSLIDVLRDNRTILDGNGLFDRVKIKPLVADNITSQTPEYKIIPHTDHDEGDFLFVPQGVTEPPPPSRPPSSGSGSRGGTGSSRLPETIVVEQPPIKSFQPPEASPVSASKAREDIKLSTLTPQQQAKAIYDWETDIIYAKNSPAVEDFLRRYPGSKYEQDARRKRAELKAQGR